MPELNTGDKAWWRCDHPIIVREKGTIEPCARWEGHTEFEDMDHMTYAQVMACFVTVLGLHEGYTEQEIQGMITIAGRSPHIGLLTVRASMIYRSKVYVHGRDDVIDEDEDDSYGYGDYDANY